MKKSAPWGDSIDTLKHSMPLGDWYNDQWPELPYGVFRLPDYYSFDLAEMREQIKQVTDNNPTVSIQSSKEGKRFNRYRGLGFFSRKDSEAPLEDHFLRRDENYGVVYPTDLHLQSKLPALYEGDFTEHTEIYNDYFDRVFSKFKSRISKASILEMRAGGWLGSHVDFPYYKGIRLHASISGCSNAWYEVNGERFQIPEDGHWYFFDTGKYHSAWNEGPDHRVTLNVNLDVFAKRNLDTRDIQVLSNNFLV